MTGRSYLARLAVLVVFVVICGLLTSQGSVADFKGNQVEARKVPWRAGTEEYVGPGCVYDDTAGVCKHGGSVPQDEYALDFGSMGAGTPVHATATGTVVDVKAPGGQPDCLFATSGYGCYVDIQHSDDGSVARYAHLSAVYATSGSVVQGQLIGLSGATGNVTGAPCTFGCWTPTVTRSGQRILVDYQATAMMT